MEIKTIENVKREIGLKVKFGKSENVSENLKVLDVLEGTITKVTSIWEHTVKDGDVCTDWTANVDVTDPKDSGIHHLTTDRVFSIDHDDKEIKDFAIIEKVAKLRAEIAELEAELEK
jgi:hypothetical protein